MNTLQGPSNLEELSDVQLQEYPLNESQYVEHREVGGDEPATLAMYLHL